MASCLYIDGTGWSEPFIWLSGEAMGKFTIDFYEFVSFLITINICVRLNFSVTYRLAL
jgi:hypothetical protein